MLNWHMDWRLASMALVALPLTIGLGVWQLQRADVKRSLAAALAERQRADVLDCAGFQRAEADPASAAELAFRRLRLVGRYDGGRQFLLDNRTFDGRTGYEAVTPFRCTSGALVLVNRGWLSMPVLDRTAVPDIPVPVEAGVLFALVGRVSERRHAAPEDTWQTPWPRRLPGFDPDRMRVLLGEPVATRPVLLEAGQPGALRTREPEAEFDPAKHVGYAVQWFAMAAGVLAWFGFASWKRAGRLGNRGGARRRGVTTRASDVEPTTTSSGPAGPQEHNHR